MPHSKRQQRAAGADLARVRAGKKPRTFKDASESALKDLATGPVKRSKAASKREHKKRVKRKGSRSSYTRY